MSIKLGSYAIFSYILPGFLFLSSVYFAIWLWKPGIDLLAHWKTLEFSNVLLLAVFSYISGYFVIALTNIVSVIPFKGKSPTELAFIEVKDTYDKVELGFTHREWAVLQSYVTLHCPELAARADTHRANGIMLRGISLWFIFLSLICIVYWLQVRVNILYCIFSAVFFIAALLAARSASNFSKWSYKSIFETTIALQGYVDGFVKPLPQASGRSEIV